MSTRGCVAIGTPDAWRGVYNHYDSYPTGLGSAVWHHIQELLKEGNIQRKIKESAAKEQEQFNNNETILLETNKHTNPKDKMKQELELYPFVKTDPRKTLIEPIIERRLAEQIEQQRLKTEN